MPSPTRSLHAVLPTRGLGRVAYPTVPLQVHREDRQYSPRSILTLSPYQPTRRPGTLRPTCRRHARPGSRAMPGSARLPDSSLEAIHQHRAEAQPHRLLWPTPAPHKLTPGSLECHAPCCRSFESDPLGIGRTRKKPPRRLPVPQTILTENESLKEPSHITLFFIK